MGGGHGVQVAIQRLGRTVPLRVVRDGQHIEVLPLCLHPGEELMPELHGFIELVLVDDHVYLDLGCR